MTEIIQSVTRIKQTVSQISLFVGSFEGLGEDFVTFIQVDSSPGEECHKRSEVADIQKMALKHSEGKMKDFSLHKVLEISKSEALKDFFKKIVWLFVTL